MSDTGTSTQAENQPKTIDFYQAFLAELRRVDNDVVDDWERFLKSDEAQGLSDADLLLRLQAEVLSRNHCGLAISGGGIRSATFGLGVLQGLAKATLLNRFQYLSTVSGGGYIGSFLSKWIKQTDVNTVVNGLSGDDRTEGPASDALRIHTRNSKDIKPIKHLRKYSNYLAPVPGIFSYDGASLLAIYFRNLFLNQLVMLLAVLSIFAAARGATELFTIFSIVNDKHVSINDFAIGASILAAVIIFLLHHFFRHCDLLRLSEQENPHESMSQSSKIARRYWIATVAIILLMATLISLFIRIRDVDGVNIDWVLVGVTISMSALGSGLLGIFLRQKADDPHWALRLVPGFLAGIIGGAIMVALLYVTTTSVETNVTFSVPVVVMSLVIGGMLYVGFASGMLSELEREWLACVNSRLMLAAGLWLAFVFLAIYSPWLFGELINLPWGSTIASVLGAGWIGTIFSGLLAASSNKTGSEKNVLLEFLAKLAPFAFLVLIVFAVSVAATWLYYDIYGWAKGYRGFLDCMNDSSYFVDLNRKKEAVLDDYPRLTQPIVLLFASSMILLFAAEFLSRRIGLNTFSLHRMYANRLVRCYLGATTDPRYSNALSDFFVDDDIPLCELTQDLPGSGHSSNDNDSVLFPIINGALNLNGRSSGLGASSKDRGDALLTRDRKAESFTFTPLHCGSESTSYAPTDEFAGSITVGTAVAVSGAAVSPNMGYHSSPGITALLTVFNLRLGAWFGNPRNTEKRKIEDPSAGLRQLESELFGMTNAKNDYVYVSDGGHFENVGIYELLRRRCRFIVAIDADCAPNIHDNVGRLVRLARIDFGIRIEIDPTPITPNEQGLTSAHLVVGRIHYGDIHPPEKESPPHDPDFNYESNQGIIVWIALGVTGDESADLRTYKETNPDFPFRSTADQFFDENEFESYRELGEHSVESMLKHFSFERENRTPLKEGVAIQTESGNGVGPHSQHKTGEVPSKPFDASLVYTLEAQTDSKHYESKREEMIRLFADASEKEIFTAIFDQWLARPTSFMKEFVVQNQQYVDMLERLKSDERLSRLANEVYGLSDDSDPEADKSQQFVEKIMIGEMMTLLENVWFSLDLEHHFLHPVHRGWVGVFRRWTGTNTFQRHWDDTAAGTQDGMVNDFSPVFRNFIEMLRPVRNPDKNS